MAPFFLTLLNVHVARRLHCVTSDYLRCFSFVVVVAVAVVFVVLATMKVRPMVCVHGSSDFLSSVLLVFILIITSQQDHITKEADHITF